MKRIAVLALVVFAAALAAGSLAFGEEAGKAPAPAAAPAAEAPKAPEAAPAVEAPKAPEAVKVAPVQPKSQTSVESRVAAVGDKAIDFTLFDVKGEKLLSFEELNKGTKKVMALVFLNSTCSSCVAEAELLASMKKKFQDDLNLIGVLTDLGTRSYETSTSENIKNAFTTVHDSKFAVPPAYGFNYTPGLVIIKGGKVIALKGGFIPGKDDKELVDLIKKNM